jgi:GNAT superfamily N-acetyltransferase
VGDVSALSVAILNIDPVWADELEHIELLSFPTANPEHLLSAADIRAYARVFPEGYFVALVEGRPVGQGAGIFIDFDFEHPGHTLAEITGESQCGNHDPDGQWYYGTDISVHPDFRGRGIGGLLYEARKDLVIREGKRGIIAGASLPGFVDHKDSMSAKDYVDRVVAGDMSDPTLSFQLSHGFEVRGMLEDYVEDESDEGWAALIVWENPGRSTP